MPTWKVPRTASQMRHVAGAPLGTRRGQRVLSAAGLPSPP